MTQHSLLDLSVLVNRRGLCCSVEHICFLVPSLLFVQPLLSESLPGPPLGSLGGVLVGPFHLLQGHE